MTHERSATWRWSICGLLLLATMLNYMDRQTLSQLSTDISTRFNLSNEQYGDLELSFGLAFVVGGLTIGFLADRINVRWMYPIVLIGWSLAGIATAYAVQIGELVAPWANGIFSHGDTGDSPTNPAYLGFLVCRGLLGFFEAGQWPCALITSRRILTAGERTMGNSLLQSGGALGAIFTPLVVQFMVTGEPDGWRLPFLGIGVLGMAWVAPWLLMIRRDDLALPAGDVAPSGESSSAGNSSAAPGADSPALFWRRFLALAMVVITINLTWHFFRAWMPKFLREFHGYEATQVNYFTSAYYVAADAGCIVVGLVVMQLGRRGWSIHSARMAMFWFCCALTTLTTLAAALGPSPLLLGLLLCIGFGSMGLFPLYYSFTQELFSRHQGKVTGTLSAITWLVTSLMHKLIGRAIDATGSYSTGLFVVGLLPLIGALAMGVLWKPESVATSETAPGTISR